MTETEQSFAAPPGPILRSEPFRVFFPLGVVLAWVGIAHWILYAAGITASYSCQSHGLVQMQAFLMAFAVGFLLTALPRRTRSAPPSSLEMIAIGVALVTVTAAAVSERWVLAEMAYGAVFLLLLQFALRRFLGASAGRRPPAAFVLIPIGVLHGIAGAFLIALAGAPRAAAWTLPLGRLFVEQGVFLCFGVGVGSLILPLMAGASPPPDLGSSPRETRKAIGFALAGVVILASFLVEQFLWPRVGPLVRAVVVANGLAFGAGTWRPPAKPGLHRRLVWIATWLVPAGLVLSAVLPDYRIPALHVVFIGGFALMAFGVATHVALSHLPGLEAQALGRPPAVAALAVAFALALGARLAADWSDTYFEHLAWAAGAWLAGSAVWLAFFGPKLLGRSR